MNRWVRALLGGLLLAVLVHIAAVFRLPEAAPRVSAARIEALAPRDAFTALETTGPRSFPGLDPFFVHAVCPFTLAEGAFFFSGELPATLWSFAVLDEAGLVVASLSGDGASGQPLDVVIGSETDIEQIRIERAGAPGGVLLPVRAAGGFALVRAFAVRAEDRDPTGAALGALVCGPVAPVVTLPEPAVPPAP